MIDRVGMRKDLWAMIQRAIAVFDTGPFDYKLARYWHFAQECKAFERELREER